MGSCKTKRRPKVRIRTRSRRLRAFEPRRQPEDRDRLLQRFGLPTCQEVHQAIQKDTTMSDEAKLQYIQEYTAGLRRLCSVVARERRLNGEKITSALMDVARTTVHQLRISAVTYGENIISMAGSDATDTQVQQECLETMRSGPECTVLWNLEEELRLRLKKPVGWSRKLWDVARDGLKVVQQGGMFVLKTLKDVVVRVFRTITEVTAYMLPYIMRQVGWLLADPRTALWALITVKALQRVICRDLSRMYMQMSHQVPKKFWNNNLGSIVQNQTEFMREFGENFGTSTLMRGLAEKGSSVISQYGGKLVDIGVSVISGAVATTSTVTAIPTGGSSAIAGMVALGAVQVAGAFLKGCIEITSEMTRDAMEYAAYRNDFDNAWSRLFEVISFQECFREWKKAVIRISDMETFGDNQATFHKMGRDAYVTKRKQDLRERGVVDAISNDIIADEIKTFHQQEASQGSFRSKHQKAAARRY